MASGPPPVYTGPSQVQPVIHPPPVVQPAVSVPDARETPRSGKFKGVYYTGLIQVVLGCISVLLGIVAIILRAGFYFIGVRLWAAILFFIVAGILGIAAGKKQQKGLVIGYLVMSIMSSCVAFAMAGTSATEITHDVYYCPDWRYGYSSYDNVACSSPVGARMAIDAMTVVLAIIEAIVAIVGASFTCSKLCCSSAPSYPRQVYYQSAPQVTLPGQQQGTVQVMYLPQQQVVQQPQYVGAVQYPHQPVMAAPMQAHYPAQMAPMVPVAPHGQVMMQAPAPPQAQVQPQAQALASAQQEDAPPISKHPEDHDSNRLIP